MKLKETSEYVKEKERIVVINLKQQQTKTTTAPKKKSCK